MKSFLTLNKKSGFTLIELLVVISIISLLSSVILASVRDARDKAKAKAFREEVHQFSVALELYKGDNGYYPGENYVDFVYYKRADGTSYTDIDAYLTSPTLESLLVNKYLPKLPTPFIVNDTFGYLSGNFKCFGDIEYPGYVILVQGDTPGFEDWAFNDNSGEEGSQRCFSIQ